MDFHLLDGEVYYDHNRVGLVVISKIFETQVAFCCEKKMAIYTCMTVVDGCNMLADGRGDLTR